MWCVWSCTTRLLLLSLCGAIGFYWFCCLPGWLFLLSKLQASSTKTQFCPEHPKQLFHFRLKSSDCFMMCSPSIQGGMGNEVKGDLGVCESHSQCENRSIWSNTWLYSRMQRERAVEWHWEEEWFQLACRQSPVDCSRVGFPPLALYIP